MRRVYISTIHRQLAPSKTTLAGELGRIYVLDWDTGQQLTEPKAVSPKYDLEVPLGKSHGARGLTIHNGALYVAGSDNRISIYNLDTYKKEGELHFSEVSYVHQIKSHMGLLHIVSTGNDRVVRLDPQDNIGEITELNTIGDKLDQYIQPAVADRKWGEDKLHFNSIGWVGGDEYHVYMNPNMIYNWTKQEVVLQSGIVDSPHDLEFIKNRIIFSSSTDRTTIAHDLGNRNTRVINKILWSRDDNKLEAVADYGFTRGIAVSENSVLCGSAPGTIREFENAGLYPFVKEIKITEDLMETIYDIVLDPRDWR